MRGLGLHTVCEEANCPNIGECWHHGTATFMILGSTCTRSCGYCNVTHGTPHPPDEQEPVKVASAIHALELSYVVVTSVDRDDLPDFGASHFARTIRETRARIPACRLEVLIPDFQGDESALRIVLDARPDVLNHNIETVPRLYRTARPGGRYPRALEVLRRSREIAPGIATKSGLMVGLGEEWDEVVADASGPSHGRRQHRHDRPVPAPVGRQPADGALLHAGRVRRAQTHRHRDGLRPRRVRPAGPQLVPRARADGRRSKLVRSCNS